MCLALYKYRILENSCLRELTIEKVKIDTGKIIPMDVLLIPQIVKCRSRSLAGVRSIGERGEG